MNLMFPSKRLFGIRFDTNLIPFDKRGGEFYNALAYELKDDESGLFEFKTFIELVEIQNSRPTVKVLIHNNPTAALKMSGSYDVILNVERAGCLVDCIPYFWEVFYDMSTTGIEYNPVLLRLCKDNLRPVNLT